MKRHVAVTVLLSVVLMMLMRVVLSRGREVEISTEVVHTMRNVNIGSLPATPTPTAAPTPATPPPIVRETIPPTPSPSPDEKVVHKPDSWKKRTWYTTSGHKELSPSLREMFTNDTSSSIPLMSRRYNEIEAALAGADRVEVASAPHPTCASQDTLQREGTGSNLYPKAVPCSRYPFGQTKPLPWDKGSYQIVKDVIVYKDELYFLPSDGPPRNGSVKWAGQFVTLRGFVNQVTTDTVEIKPLPEELVKEINSFETREVALYQPATDFAALWHTVVEVVLPLFHAALPYIQQGHNVSVVQHLSRQRTIPPPMFVDIYKQRGLTWTCCALSPATCMSTPYGQLYKNLASGGLVYNPQDGDRPILFRRMVFGTPTNCIPVWGIDALFQAATKNVDEECASVFWAWRTHWLRYYNSRRLPSLVLPLPHNEVKVLWASRRLSESRRIDNEGELIAAVNSLITSPVVLTNFDGTLSDQFDLLQSATHLVSPHGAALVNVIMMRVNSFVVMLDIHFPPFTGFSMEVPWVHHVHYNSELTCNPSHYKNAKKKRCKYIYTKPEGMHHIHNFPTSEHNNNLKGGVGLIEAINSTLQGGWSDLSYRFK